MSWEKVLVELSKTIAHRHYEPYIKPLTLYRMSKEGVILIAPSVSIKAVLDKRYIPIMEDSIRKVLGQKLKVEITTEIKELGIGSKSNLKQLQELDTNGELAIVQKYLTENFDFKYNIITDETLFKRKTDEEFKTLDGRTMNSIYIGIKTNKNYKHINKDTLHILLNSEFVKSYHPIKEYFEKHKDTWKGETNPLGDLCKFIKVQNPKMNFEEYFKKFCFRMLHMIYYPGKFVNEHILILQSPQKYGKTTFFQNIFPLDWDAYINSDTSLDFMDKDLSITASKTIVHICDEFDKIFKYEVGADAMKEFMSNYSKIKRQAYGRTARHFKKMCSFFGTTNSMQFLFNKEGNRRYIIFRLAEKIDFGFQGIDTDELWSQIFNLYLKAVGSKFQNRTQIDWTDKQSDAIDENVLLHQKELSEAEYIQRYFEAIPKSEYNESNPSHLWKTSLDIKEFLLNIHPKLNFYEGSIGKAMARLGFHKSKDTGFKAYLIKLKEAKLLKKFEND